MITRRTTTYLIFAVLVFAGLAYAGAELTALLDTVRETK